jgi:transcriptional regulator with XRE-family HTH domain
MDIRQFGTRLRLAREQKGLTQEELVERLGRKTTTAISEYENGKRKISAIELPDYARALGIPITFFFLDTIEAEDDLEVALLEWFRQLPSKKRRWVVKHIRLLEPIIIGGLEDGKG